MSRKSAKKAETDEGVEEEVAECCASDSGDSSSSSSPVYGLGMIGALVWFWSQAETPEERAAAVLKAIVWPAFLVHDAFKALSD